MDGEIRVYFYDAEKGYKCEFVTLPLQHNFSVPIINYSITTSEQALRYANYILHLILNGTYDERFETALG
jgi:hypothetical protein